MEKSKIYNTDWYVKKAKEIHGDRYDYSLVDYKRSKEKVKIICKEHGVFEILAVQHIRKNPNGCHKCTHTFKNTKEDFIKKSIEIHGNRYDYSLVDYVNNNTKVKIACKAHGVFEQLPRTHISGFGCKKCGKEKPGLYCRIKKTSDKIQKLSKEDFISKAVKIHGDKYDYSLVDYKNVKTKVKIICKEHGVFEQAPFEHLRGCECTPCAKNIASKKNISDLNYFLKNAKKAHGNKYDYSKVDYKGVNYKVDIICKKHGIFSQRAFQHMNGNGCPICKESKGESVIRNILKSSKIKFTPQKKFKGCKNKSLLSYDFYISSEKLLIEFNGIQHYKPVNIFGGEEKFKIQKENDKIKKKFAKENGYKLLVISYKEFNNIEKILKKHLKSLN